MAFWINTISWKKVAQTALIYTIVAFIIHQLEALFTVGYYTNPQYLGVWSKLMMPSNGAPPASFMIYSVVFAFITGISLALIYYYLRDHLPQNKTKRILYFADLMIATSFIFFTLPTYLLLNVPVVLLVTWFITGFVVLVIESFVLVKIIN